MASSTIRRWCGPFDPELLREKVRCVYRMAAENGHDALVLGAFGCGYFGNPEQVVAKTFKDVLAREFASAFDVVVFAVPGSSRDPNLKAFAAQFKMRNYLEMQPLLQELSAWRRILELPSLAAVSSSGSAAAAAAGPPADTPAMAEAVAAAAAAAGGTAAAEEDPASGVGSFLLDGVDASVGGALQNMREAALSKGKGRGKRDRRWDKKDKKAGSARDVADGVGMGEEERFGDVFKPRKPHRR